MARLYPFRALRYNPSLVRMQDVVTQPYDKISPSMQQAYYQRSPYNLVRVILGLPELFDQGGDIYARAARDFNDWRAEGILAQEKDPCIFAYSQRFPVPGAPGTMLERKGFIALGELYEYAQNVVFRHEQTLSRPKADRLNLLKATRAHFGQIFMLYSDPAMTAEKLLFNVASAPEIEVTDEYGVLHRVSKVSEPGTINMLITAMADKKLIIADGHHRYETALSYSRERAPVTTPSTERKSSSLPQPSYPEAAAMMTFVNMDSEGLVILPTHRVVHSLKGFSTTTFLADAAPWFSTEQIPSQETRQLTSRLQSTPGTAFIAVTADGAYLLTAKSQAVAEALGAVSNRQKKLDVVQLHALILEKLLGISPEAIREQTNVRYVRDAGEGVDQVRRGEANITFLTKPVTLDQLREIAFAGDVLPQKSTDFFPKLLSGLAIYAFD